MIKEEKRVLWAAQHVQSGLPSSYGNSCSGQGYGTGTGPAGYVPVPVLDAGGVRSVIRKGGGAEQEACEAAGRAEVVSLCCPSVPGSPFQWPSRHLHLDIPKCLKLLIVSHLTMTLQYLYFNLTCLSKVTKSRELFIPWNLCTGDLLAEMSISALILIQLLCARVCPQSLSRVQLFATPWTVARQAFLSVGFSRQEFWSGVPFPPPGDLPDPGIECTPPASPALAASSSLRHLGSPSFTC